MNVLQIYMTVLAAVFGLVIGSFLNVVICRLPDGRSLVRPGSRCPACDSPVRWHHNVPILGWLILRGRCRDCGNPISARYPAVEALTGVAFVCAYLLVGPTPELLLGWAFLAALIAITFIDLDHFIIPNKIVVPGAVLGLAVSVFLHPERWWEYLLSGLGAAGFLLAIGLIWPGGMGFGDVKMALMMGMVLGRLVLVAMFLAFLVGGIAGVVLLALRFKKRKDRIPFGPYLAVGAAAGFLLGERVLDAYLGLYS